MKRAVIGAALIVLAMLLWTPIASAEVTQVFTGETVAGAGVPCQTRADGTRQCSSDTLDQRVLSHGDQPRDQRIPLDVTLTLPSASSADGNYPLVLLLHGWGGSKDSIGGGIDAQDFADRYAHAGYAVLRYSSRAWAKSCGKPTYPTDPTCASRPTWNHLADARYEVRDAQYLSGLLADEASSDGTGIVDPQRIGSTGVSYGGGQTTILAALRDRVMRPDGSLAPWTSPQGKPMRLAAAAPIWPWTDLAYSLAPNGRTLDYVADAPYRGPDGSAPVGVLKTSYENGLFATGSASSQYAPPGSDPDLTSWHATFNGGEPYGAPADEAARQLTRFHSGYYIDHSQAPAPTLFNNGWADDLFPVDEALRFINRTQTEHPGAAVSLVASDYGHARSQNKQADVDYALGTVREWFDHYLLGTGTQPPLGVRARALTCPSSAPSGQTVSAATFNALSPGEVRYDAAGPFTVSSEMGGSPQAAQAYDPIAGPGACATAPAPTGGSSVTVERVASTDLTLAGSPTVIADIAGGGPNTQLAARLLDVDSGNQARLLGRGVLRPQPSGRQVFQLHPDLTAVPKGHRIVLEMLGHETPTGRHSNVPFTLRVSNLQLRLPVRETKGPGVSKPKPPVVPSGYRLAPGAG